MRLVLLTIDILKDLKPFLMICIDNHTPSPFSQQHDGLKPSTTANLQPCKRYDLLHELIPMDSMVTCATLFSIWATTLSAALSKNVPVLVRISLGILFPVLLSTTVDLVIDGFAYSFHTSLRMTGA